MKTINLLIILLLTAVMAYPQHRLMQIHSEGEVAYKINTAQVDSITFAEGKRVCGVSNPLALPRLKEIIEDFERDVEIGYKVHARIYQCTYKDGDGFLIEPYVASDPGYYTLVNCEGTTLCEIGRVYGVLCQDQELDIDLKNKKLIWEIDEDGEFVLMWKGTVHYSPDFLVQRSLVISTSEEWRELLKSFWGTDCSMGKCITEEDYWNIDFSTYQVIAIFDNARASEGWSIDITDITEYADSIVITIQNLRKGESTELKYGGQPFHFVKIPTSDKEIIFHEELIKNELPGEISYTLHKICGLVNFVYGDVVLTINSEEDFEKYIKCDNYPEIDFSKQTLILAKGSDMVRMSPIQTVKIQQFPTKYVLSIFLVNTATPGPHQWNITLIVDKLSEEKNVELNIR